MKKPTSTNTNLPAFIAILLLLIIWQILTTTGMIPSFMLPSPVDVVYAFVHDISLLWQNLFVTLKEAALGLGLGVGLGLGFAFLMDRVRILRDAIYPILVLTQTVPTVAIAPLLVLWMGYGIAPKVVLILIVTFFPITTNVLEGLASADPDQIDLLRAMGASKQEIFRYVQWPQALPAFFSSLKIAASYAVVGAVIAEWLGGTEGLGVYMTRVKASYAYDRMFAVIFLISALSLLLLKVVDWLRYLAIPWERKEKR